MTPDERRMIADIERDERWLREHAPPTPGPASLEPLKLRVQMAVNEEAIARHATVPVSPACVSRIKDAIRHELAASVAGMPRRRRFARRTLAAGLSVIMAAAAALAFLLVPGKFDTSVKEDPLADLVAAVEARQATEAADFASLRDELEEAEAELVGYVSGPNYESDIDDLSQEMDDLLEELNTYMDSARAPA